jgi:hypothetical protein
MRQAAADSYSHNIVIADDDAVNFERKLDEITEGHAGRRQYLKDHLLNRISRENCLTIINYILDMQVEINPAERYRLDTIAKLKQLAEFHNPKSFHALQREDIYASEKR